MWCRSTAHAGICLVPFIRVVAAWLKPGWRVRSAFPHTTLLHNHQVVACRTTVHNVTAACLKHGWLVRSDKACPNAMLLYNQVGQTSP